MPIKQKTRCGIKDKIVVMGASAGGIKTLKFILSEIPRDFKCPILICQHISPTYYKLERFAFILNLCCDIETKVAEDGEFLYPGVAYICPPARHMEIALKDDFPCIKLLINEKINHGMPCIDILFRSISRIYKDKAMGIILTGTLRDGVDGLKEIRQAKGKTIAESKETAEQYGMPRRAIEEGAAMLSVPNYEIKNHLVRFTART